MGARSGVGAKLRRAFVSVCFASAFALGAIQLLPAPSRTNPPVSRDKTIEARLNVTPQVDALLHRACINCHSHETAWPWYGRVAPFSWMLGRDVNAARTAMNLSQWTPNPAEQIAYLTAACANLEGGRMPPAGYRLMHPEARVTPAEAKTFCAWTKTRISSILASNGNGQAAATAPSGTQMTISP
jgi:Haem-binding domain